MKKYSLCTNIVFILFLILCNKSILANEINQDFAHIQYYTSEGKQKHEQMPLSTEVQVKINGVAARTKIVHTFSNNTSEWLEGKYRFPLPDNAAVDSLKMIIGQQVIIGEIQEKQKAERTYQNAKKSGKRATLVKQVRANLFTTKLANIGPEESISIEIEFQQLIHIDGTEFNFTLPMGITPRYQPTSTNINQKFSEEKLSEIVTEFNTTSNPDRPINFEIELNAGFEVANINSINHPIKTQVINSKQLITLENSAQANQDFILKWQPKQGQQPSATLLSESIGEYHYNLLVIVPPTHDLVQPQIQPREIIFVVDSSGSMSGQSMEQAKAGLQYALQQLNPNDSFNIIDFDDKTVKLFSKAQSINDSSLEQATVFINRLNAEGGTEIGKAVDIALDKPNSKKLRQVIFLTDGSIGNEQNVFSIIKNKLGNNRLFTIGIGSAPNSYFMRKAAEHGRGTFTYISNISQVQTELQTLFKKLRYPVLSNLSFNDNDTSKNNIELHPKYLRDLYLGEPLYASYRTPISSGDSFKLTGNAQSYVWSFDLPQTTNGNDSGIAKLWARMKIDSLKNDLISDYQNAEVIKEQILSTALDFHLVSDYTSLVAVDKTPVHITNNLKQLQLSNPMPAGWKAPMTHGYPRGGTDSLLMLLLGLISLFFAGIYWLRYK